MTCDRWDVVVVPFPFVEKAGAKRRPALVLSDGISNRAGHSVLAMITSKAHRPWPGDTEITNLSGAGLSTACIVRLKMFTLDNRLILQKIGTLGKSDVDRLIASLRGVLP